MRRVLFIGVFSLLTPSFAHAQAQPYRVVFDLTSRVEDDPYGDTRALWDDVATEHLRISR